MKAVVVNQEGTGIEVVEKELRGLKAGEALVDVEIAVFAILIYMWLMEILEKFLEEFWDMKELEL